MNIVIKSMQVIYIMFSALTLCADYNLPVINKNPKITKAAPAPK